jgi:CRP-like cAMP-binding protein
MTAPSGNKLLDALSPGCHRAILSLSKEIPLPVRTQLYWPGEMPRYGFFLTSGMASVVAGLGDGGSTEVGVIGKEGVVGAFHVIGPIPSMTECFMQVAGRGYRIPLDSLRDMFKKHEEIRERVLEFVQGQSVATSQIAACNKLHEAEPRLARWLLMIGDRVASDTILITQEFIGQMIGTRRTTVNGILSSMEKTGLISHTRGKITIPDRNRLVDAACDCYPLIRDSLNALYS